MKVELLILISGDDTFCNTAKSFSNFLKIDSLISITQQKISYKRSANEQELVSAKLHIETNKVKSNNERFFLVILECENSDHIDEFSELIDRLKTIVERISPGTCTINTLWDDVGRIYAERSYPVINQVENLMRRLIARFMLITVGMKWTKDSIQPELFSKIENFEEEEPYIDDLHKLDFIHLSHVLFGKKRDISLEELDRLLLKTKFSQEDMDKILKYIPKSNWEKYFSSIVDEKDTSLESKWSLLYKLRNKVAHNRSVKKSEHDQIKGLSTAIEAIISRATEKLGEININEQDRELIIHSYQPNSATALAYNSEKAVGEYYGSLDYLLTSGGPGIPFDFIASKDNETIGIEVKVARLSTLHVVIVNTIARHTPAWIRYQNRESLTGIRLICIVTDYTTEEQANKLLKSIEKFRKSLNSGIDIHIGELDESNEYIPRLELTIEKEPPSSFAETEILT